jgi:SAM-dependent methyltransferase
MTQSYWQDAAADEAMQEEHCFVWSAMLDTIDVDLTGKRVLDAGCNQGGFLRLVADRFAISHGFGYDPASGAIEDARRLAEGRRLTFEVSDTVPEGWDGFDVAFSHEVLYLVHDLPLHARALFAALAPDGVYYAVIGVHTGSPLMVTWHRENVDALNLPRLNDIEDVIAVFERAGFEAAAGRLAVRFVPAAGHHGHGRGRLLDWLDYYYDRKLLLRFTPR